MVKVIHLCKGVRTLFIIVNNYTRSDEVRNSGEVVIDVSIGNIMPHFCKDVTPKYMLLCNMLRTPARSA